MAKAITLIESTREQHRAQADALLEALLARPGKSFRIGISGTPGVGKSTLIETLGLHLLARGHRLAVLAVDPSSSVSGGSILGDKTRMERLSVHPGAFIRPSPTAGNLGGVAAKTREAILVCEAAGYDIVIVETVGVGQSEIAVAGMTDIFILMQLPNGGDDLQALKRGVMELADLVVVNKADLDPMAAARAQAHVSSSLRLTPQAHGLDVVAAWRPRVMQLSAATGTGLEALWHSILEFREFQKASGALEERRSNQNINWLWEQIAVGLQARFRSHAGVQAGLAELSEEVKAGRTAASVAARQLLGKFDDRRDAPPSNPVGSN